uniref:Cytidyltransferase-like domain-containing protein n=1 Tax=Ditylenchus dipsaci TaxID=166011 RepID=A0A915DSQ9_9BILA
MFENVVITGTFDRFHKGHRHFIRSALALTTSRLTVGVSDNDLEYLKTKKLHENIQSVNLRMSVVENFLDQEDKRRVQIQVLRNTVAFENYLADDLDCMIFTEESANIALIVNKLREANHLSPIKAHIVEWRYKDVSSTAKRMIETQNEVSGDCYLEC